MTSSESNGRRSKRRRKRRANRQAPSSTPSVAADAPGATALAEDSPPDETPLEEDDVVESTLSDATSDATSDDARDEVEIVDEASAQAPNVRTAADADRLAELTCELIERDELIAALTDQLEDAAERLDRLHREGFDRGPSGSTSNPGFTLPPGSSEMKEQVSQLVQAWEELDALAWMQEFDRKLDQLTSLCSQGNAGRPKPPSQTLTDSWMGRVDDREGAEDSPSSRLAGWEEMKAQYLNEGEADEIAPAPVDQVERTPVSEPPPVWDLDAPEPVDLDEADRDALIAAVEERDDFISLLISRLRAAPAARPEPIDWEKLNNAPDDLRERLQKLQARLEEVLRMEECDLSLERARLARERARLEQMGRKARRLRDASDAPEAAGDEELQESEVSQNERRWLRVFGFGRKPDELDDEFDDDDLD